MHSPLLLPFRFQRAHNRFPLLLCIFALALLSGCSNFVEYNHTAGRPLRVSIDPKMKVREQVLIMGLTEAIGGAMAMAPGTGAAVKAAGSALEKKGMQSEPAPHEMMRTTFVETFSSGLRQDPRFQLVNTAQAEALFHFDMYAYFGPTRAFDRDIAAQVVSVSELKARDGTRLWYYITHLDDASKRELHDPDLIRRDPELRARALQKTTREVAEEHLLHLRKKR